MNEEEKTEEIMRLVQEVQRLTREREDARFVARLVARLAGLDEKRIDWEGIHEL